MRTPSFALAIVLSSSVALAGMREHDRAPFDAPSAPSVDVPAAVTPWAPSLAVAFGVGGGTVGGNAAAMADLSVLQTVTPWLAVGAAVTSEVQGAFTGDGSGASALGGLRRELDAHWIVGALAELGVQRDSASTGLLGPSTYATLGYAGVRATLDYRFGVGNAFDLGVTGILGGTLGVEQRDVSSSVCFVTCTATAPTTLTVGGASAMAFVHVGVSFDEGTRL